jgi:hypothetical protein
MKVKMRAKRMITQKSDECRQARFMDSMCADLLGGLVISLDEGPPSHLNSFFMICRSSKPSRRDSLRMVERAINWCLWAHGDLIFSRSRRGSSSSITDQTLALRSINSFGRCWPSKSLPQRQPPRHAPGDALHLEITSASSSPQTCSPDSFSMYKLLCTCISFSIAMNKRRGDAAMGTFEINPLLLMFLCKGGTEALYEPAAAHQVMIPIFCADPDEVCLFLTLLQSASSCSSLEARPLFCVCIFELLCLYRQGAVHSFCSQPLAQENRRSFS